MQQKRVVFILEDDELLLKAMRIQLIRIQAKMEHKFEVVEATTVAQAKAVLQTIKGDAQVCILSDGELSDGDGVDFIQYCREELGSQLLDGRVCTGDISGKLEVKGKAAGVIVHRKPYVLLLEYGPILKTAFHA
jgi:CheY-like chemotaxis protein